MADKRQTYVQTITSWKGKRESDGSHKAIIDIYNKQKDLPRGYKVKYTDNWCATTTSAAAIAAGCADIVPIECSCGNVIEKAKAMGIWVENDAFTPKPGDLVLYDWGDSGKGDNTGWPEHIGAVVKVENGKMTIIEGNKDNAVGQRTVAINGKFIRGFVTPKYEAAASSQKASPAAPKQEAPKPAATPTPTATYKTWNGKVNTPRGLNVRKGPGTNYGKLYAVPNNTTVTVFEEKAGWYHVHIAGRADGWVSGAFIKK